MKTNLPFLLLLILGLILIGCKPSIKLLYGIKQPKFETSESIESYLEKRKVPSDNVLIIKDLNGLININNGDFSVPNALFFNANGEYVEYRKSPEDCNANIFGFIEDIASINYQPADSSKNMDLIIANVKHIHSEKVKVEDRRHAYIFITWAKYAGKLNKDKAFAWVDLINSANKNGLNVEYFLLNYDLQQSWNLTEEQKKELLSQFKI